MDWVCRTLNSDHVAGGDVLEVGSFDVNGSVRPYIESLGPRRYLGVDASPGPRVDRVVDCEQLTTEIKGLWDVVISTEMLEHVRDWRTCVVQLAAMVKPGGLLLITTRSPGFPYHPFPEDHWRYTNDQMRAILDALGLEILTLEDDPDPGVFALARKPTTPLDCAGLDDIDVEVVAR
jgi:hypothetical protein